MKHSVDSESQRIIVSGNEFQTVGAEQRKARFAKSVLVNGLSSSGAVDQRSVIYRIFNWSVFALCIYMYNGHTIKSVFYNHTSI